MSLYVGFRRNHPVAGIVGFSGRLLAPELLANDLRSRPPTLLVHGTDDPLVSELSSSAFELLEMLDQFVDPLIFQNAPGLDQLINELAACGLVEVRR